MDKHSLRKEMRNRIKAFPDKKEESGMLCELIAKNGHFRDASVVLAFSPMPDEPDITPLFDERFLFPYAEGDRMKFGRPPLEMCPMGFREPVDKTEIPFDDAVILVPGRAFTQDGERLGRGGGFYDRYLKENKKKLHSIGICFSVQLVGSIPVDPCDVPVDEVLII